VSPTVIYLAMAAANFVVLYSRCPVRDKKVDGTAVLVLEATPRPHPYRSISDRGQVWQVSPVAIDRRNHHADNDA